MEYISCTSLNQNLAMLSNSGVNINDSIQVKNHLNIYYNAQFSYFAYQQVISNCATIAGSYVLPRKGTAADFVESAYRFGFNGKEDDSEVEGQQDYGMRIYDRRLARFKSVDPLTKEYPMLTPYQFASNSPIDGIDLDGLEHYYAADGRLIGKIGTSTEIRKVDTKNVRTVSFWINAANKPPKAADVGFTGRATDYANSFSSANVEKAKPEPSIFYRTIYGDAYSRGIEGTDNMGNDREAPGGPDAAGTSLGVEAANIGGVHQSLLESSSGTKAYTTIKTAFSASPFASISGGPTLDFSWKTSAYENKLSNELIPGPGDYYSIGFGVNFTLTRALDSKTGATTMIGFSIGLGAGVSAGNTYTFETIGKAKE